MSAMHHDTSADLNVVGNKLKNVFNQMSLFLGKKLHMMAFVAPLQ